MACLAAFRDIGEALEETWDIHHEAAPGPSARRAFSAWCDENDFDREWRARLMRLAADWQGIKAAVQWAQATKGRELGRKEYSVDGALALVEEWLIADPAGAHALTPAWGKRAAEAGNRERQREADRAQRKAEREAAGDGEGSAGGDKASSAADLRRALAEALERIWDLEGGLVNARGGEAKPVARARKTRQPAE